MILQLSCNLKKLQFSQGSSPPTSSETYPYPKGEHNGAVGPKYASFLKMCPFFVDSVHNFGKSGDEIIEWKKYTYFQTMH